MDAIGDFLTVIRNASRVKKPTCEVPFSRLKKEIAEILRSEGYIADIADGVDKKGLPRLHVRLKYVRSIPALTAVKRCSTPGCRWYVGKDRIPKVLNGLGVSILSTSRGVMSDRDARKLGVGGELICQVW
jgi:small subunit ribosomal protein S8